MKKLLMMLLLLPAISHAETLQDVSQWIAKQDVRTGIMYDLNRDAWGASYWVPVSYGSKKWRSGKGVAYMDFLVGAAYKSGRKSKGLVGVLFHPANLGKLLLSKLPNGGLIAGSRFQSKKLMDIAVGPTLAMDQSVFFKPSKLKGKEVIALTAAFKF